MKRYSLFQILDGIMDLNEKNPSREEILDSTNWIMEYAAGACNTAIREDQAARIQAAGKYWLAHLESDPADWMIHPKTAKAMLAKPLKAKEK